MERYLSTYLMTIITKPKRIKILQWNQSVIFHLFTRRWGSHEVFILSGHLVRLGGLTCRPRSLPAKQRELDIALVPTSIDGAHSVAAEGARRCHAKDDSEVMKLHAWDTVKGLGLFGWSKRVDFFVHEMRRNFAFGSLGIPGHGGMTGTHRNAIDGDTFSRAVFAAEQNPGTRNATFLKNNGEADRRVRLRRRGQCDNALKRKSGFMRILFYFSSLLLSRTWNLASFGSIL